MIPSTLMGEALSFRGVYDEHFGFVWRSLRRLGVPESDVADAVQEVFLVVHRKLSEFEGRSKVSTWLFSIAMRVAKDRSRLAVNRRQVLDDDAVARHVDVGADLHQQAERTEAAHLLESILSQMPMEQRGVFVLFELEGLTCQDIADLMQTPLGTVYSRLRLARECFERNVARLRAKETFRAQESRPSGVTFKAGVEASNAAAEASPAPERRSERRVAPPLPRLRAVGGGR